MAKAKVQAGAKGGGKGDGKGKGKGKGTNDPKGPPPKADSSVKAFRRAHVIWVTTVPFRARLEEVANREGSHLPLRLRKHYCCQRQRPLEK